jgi:hypothetical protein
MILDRESRTGGRIWLPEDEQGWKDRYNWLFDWYSGRDYSLFDHAQLNLFRAIDYRGDVIADTRRVQEDARFVIDTDARILGSGRWSLEASRGVTARDAVTAGEAVWARSQLQERKHEWLLQAAMIGDYWLEAVREAPGKVRIYGYDPRWCEVTYDDAGLYPVRLVVTLAGFADPAHSIMRSPMRRTITSDAILVERYTDAATWEIDESASGPHGLGVAPLAHLRLSSIAGLPEHGLWAGFGMDGAMQAIDGAHGQLRAIFTRYAHPHLVITGSKLSDPDVEQFGRIIQGLHQDSKVEYLEAGMAALAPMIEHLRLYRSDVRDTIPEFALSGVGANTSGTAISMRLDELRRKMGEIQTRVSGAISRLTQYAYHMETGSAYDEDSPMFRVRMPPALPADTATTIGHLIQLRGARLIRAREAVQVLQSTGLLDEQIDVDAYVAELDAEQPAAPEPRPLTPPASTDTLVSGDSDDV